MSRSDWYSAVVSTLREKTERIAHLLIQGSRRLSHKAIAPPQPLQVSPLHESSLVPPEVSWRRMDRAGGTRVSSHRCFRVLFVVRPGPVEALCTRYRGYNVMEALRLAGVEADHMDDRRFHERLEEMLGYDLVVLVRRRLSPDIDELLAFADQYSIPVICDLDDYLFDDEVIPCSDHLVRMPLEEAQALIRGFRELVLRTSYYTGATAYLVKQAASLGKTSYLIPNGINLVQLELSRLAVEEIRQSPDRAEVRIGYFSGTLTHHSDFRMIAPVLIRLLEEFPQLTLTVAGDFDLAQIPRVPSVCRPCREAAFRRLATAPLGDRTRRHQSHSPGDQSIHGRQERPEVLRGGLGRGSERSFAHRSLPVLHQARVKRISCADRGRLAHLSPNPDPRSGLAPADGQACAPACDRQLRS